MVSKFYKHSLTPTRTGPGQLRLAQCGCRTWCQYNQDAALPLLQEGSTELLCIGDLSQPWDCSLKTVEFGELYYACVALIMLSVTLCEMKVS